ncbi:MAG: alpha-amylase family glycosyl hydrolase [Crocinitomicaceae bacterium]
MTEFTWWQKGIVYQIYPRSFMDSNNDGIGDLQGIIDKLEYLNDGTEQSMGVDAIWISPFYPSPMADFGYDVADYCNVDPMFGDLETFDTLVTEAHKHNIKIIVDFVPNHSSKAHEWFKESRQSKTNPKRDWYIWKDAKADGSPPNNWQSVFGGDAWTWDETTQQYYFHQFDPAQPDLNWRNPEVKEAMLDVLRFWLERGVDGFRMDVVYMIMKHPDMPDYVSDARDVTDNSSLSEQHPAFDYPGIQDIFADMRVILDDYSAIGIAEVWLSDEKRNAYFKNFEMPFNFDFLNYDTRNTWSADFFRETIRAYEDGLPDGAFPNYVLGSHDAPRLASRYGSEARARMAGILLLTLRGTPTLYMGDEIGMVDGDISAEQVQDPQGKNMGVEYTRDVCRTPMQWDDSLYAGFSESETWLPVNADYPSRNIEAQSKDDYSILTLYRKLIWYRKAHLSLSIGEYQTIDAPDNVFAFIRKHKDEQHVVIANFGTEHQTVTLPTSGTLILNSTLTREGHIGNRIQLAGDEAVLILLD